jgi:hypothetical protein
MRRRMRTTIGASLAVLCLLLAPASALRGKGEDPAVVAGTVFREPGFALPRAQVQLTVKTPPQGMKPPKPQKTLSDGRGEFSFRVPAAASEYVVTVKADGYESQEKTATLSGAPERVDVYFNLNPVQ